MSDQRPKRRKGRGVKQTGESRGVIPAVSFRVRHFEVDGADGMEAFLKDRVEEWRERGDIPEEGAEGT